jgi:hypothetical protein
MGSHRVKYGVIECSTFAEIDGEEHDVIVEYWTSPAEPLVDWAGGLDIEGVYLENQPTVEAQEVDQLPKMTACEVESLQQRLNEIENDRHSRYEEEL